MAGIDVRLEGSENQRAAPSKSPDQFRSEALNSVGNLAQSCQADPGSVKRLGAEVGVLKDVAAGKPQLQGPVDRIAAAHEKRAGLQAELIALTSELASETDQRALAYVSEKTGNVARSAKLSTIRAAEGHASGMDAITGNDAGAVMEDHQRNPFVA